MGVFCVFGVFSWKRVDGLSLHLPAKIIQMWRGTGGRGGERDSQHFVLCILGSNACYVIVADCPSYSISDFAELRE